MCTRVFWGLLDLIVLFWKVHWKVLHFYYFKRVHIRAVFVRNDTSQREWRISETLYNTWDLFITRSLSGNTKKRRKDEQRKKVDSLLYYESSLLKEGRRKKSFTHTETLYKESWCDSALIGKTTPVSDDTHPTLHPSATFYSQKSTTKVNHNGNKKISVIVLWHDSPLFRSCQRRFTESFVLVDRTEGLRQYSR